MLTQTTKARPLSRPIRWAGAALAGGLLVWTQVAAAAPVPESFAGLVKKVSPAVVLITSEIDHPTASGDAGPQNAPNPFEGTPFEDFFKHFGPMQQAPQGPERALGSGFVIDADGYVVTNNHVVDKADKVSIKLSDGRQFDAKVLGTDPKTDLALLKVKTDKPLPTVTWGDSDKMEVGDWVLAIGNPFGLGGTVTAGIVSARGRDIGAGPYDDFIQTDAAINRGNSGGPMFNIDGKVIGINSAIYSPNGGSVGIGFAIPSNLAQNVIAQLREHGSVERGWLGVKIQQVTPELAQAFGIKEDHGALVADVFDHSPAQKAGFKSGDVITQFNGEQIDTMRDLPRLVAAVKPGTDVDVEVLRNGQQKSLDVTIAKMNPQQTAALEQPSQGESDKLGAKLSALTPELRDQLQLDSSTKGVVVTGVAPNGLAARQGLKPGDVISEVDGKTVDTPAALDKAIDQAREHDKKAVALLVKRDGNALYLGLTLAGA
ncbi:serine protease Do [Tistlia consotensis]|uniref:Probable periplasmic serine endoprotease DegP-like n=1 Tax=Tistlia consotensis USBA 355 TaxID=560819 RepID=A0A1Y6CFJ8_9PROT|nr:DegQ family serine endoprotease [Tistlia consotensis]SMF60575.1 serine protease Do [Tistlia consotensis USBA 355]SNR93219.1 serine protease Do [Tistlia consotensis]